MLKTLWSGVSGLQAHQIAMDVESNNIANVNTVGFKYSRANFADMLSQVKKIATAPQGGLGGQNDLSIGLGTSITSTTKIFLQGSMQSTDKNTDMALQGDGFFVLSGDRGITQRYTRSGDFVFDANGNLVDNNGLIVQGWLKSIAAVDSTCETEDNFTKVDDTGPIGNIRITPGQTLPAKKSSDVTLKANLSSSNTIDQMECIYQLDSDANTTSVHDSLNMKYDSDGKIIQVAEDFGVLFNDSGEAYNLTKGQGIWVSYNNAIATSDFNTGAGDSAGTITINDVSITYNNDSATTGITNASAAVQAINAKKNETGVEASIAGNTITLVNRNDNTNAPKKNITISVDGTGGLANFTSADNSITAFKYKYTDNVADSGTSMTSDRNFKTTEDLRRYIQGDANFIKDSASAVASVKVTINKYGRFEVTNQTDADLTNTESLTFAVTAFYDSFTSANTKFTQTFASLNSTVVEGSGVSISSTAVNAAKHATSIDIFDSLGTKHTLRLEFRKTDRDMWRWRAIVPEPGELIGHPDAKKNIYEGGTVTFNNDGSLKGFNPPTLQYNPNNGAKSPQIIRMSFGQSGTFNGLSSVDDKSYTSNISQNGYAAGEILGMRVDSTGTILGSFSNGKTVALAKVALAKFANNAGLQSEGNNLFTVSANSGDPMIGAAGTGGRAEVAASTLEMSNVDLSRSLTQLITIQRGYQANSKSITTADQLLNTLLGLKQ